MRTNKNYAIIFLKFMTFFLCNQLYASTAHQNVFDYSVDQFGLTELHRAVEDKDLKKIKELVARRDIVVRENDGLIMKSISRFNLEVKDGNGSTPLHNACSDGRLDIFEVLYRAGADINCIDRHGNTPLHSAVNQGYKGICKRLLELHVDYAITNKFGVLPLHEVASCTLKKDKIILLIQLFMSHNIDINMQDPNGCTLLHHFANKEYAMTPEILRFILSHGGDCLVRNKIGQTPQNRIQYIRNRAATYINTPENICSISVISKHKLTQEEQFERYRQIGYEKLKYADVLDTIFSDPMLP